MTIKELCGKVRRAVSLRSQAGDYVLANKEYRDALLDMERERLFRGELADGTPISPQYAPSTKAAKSRHGLPSDRVTLFDTGAFYAGFTAENNGGDVLFSSTDAKTGKLIEKYGDGIFGLNDEDRRAARSGSVALIREWFRAVTGI